MRDQCKCKQQTSKHQKCLAKKLKFLKIHRECSGRATENLKTVLDSWWSGLEPSTRKFVRIQTSGFIQYDKVIQLKKKPTNSIVFNVDGVKVKKLLNLTISQVTWTVIF